MSRFSIGLDLGGTKIEAVVLEEGVERVRMRVPTPRDDYAATLETLVRLVSQLEQRVGDRATVGVGIPGSIEPSTNLVKNANSVWLIGKPLGHDLERRLDRRVVIANDANCFTLSEATDGAGAGAEVVFGVILGTGVGGGIASRGAVRRGRNGIAGEWGHNPLPWMNAEEYPGSACYCGKRGCVETFLSGPALAADHLRHHGDACTPETLVSRAIEGDSAADGTLRRFEHRLARALASVINVLDPDVIVLGGGLSKIERVYDAVPRHWAEYVFACSSAGSPLRAEGRRAEITTMLKRAEHGDASGVRGAAWLGARG
jgi:fructokinase